MQYRVILDRVITPLDSIETSGCFLLPSIVSAIDATYVTSSLIG